LLLDIVDVIDVSFSDSFSGDFTGLGRESVEGIIKNDLESMDQTSVAVDEMIPDEVFDMNFSSGFDPGCEVPLFPDVMSFITGSSWDLVLMENFNIASAISQESINLLLENVFTEDHQWNVNELLVDLLGEDFEGFSSDTSADKKTIMRLSVPPVIDLRASQMRICINDMILQYMIKDIPQWEASVDIDIIVEPRVNTNSIDIYLTPIEQNCHFHIMRDNPGNLGIFDHSSLVSDVFEAVPDMVGGSSDDPSITIDIDLFSPAIVFSKTDSPLSISSGNGYLYLNMDVSNLDLSQMSAWEKRCE
ncbi:MAG: hypothetical protein JXM72_05530, partial [Deltaproteobacteria bacterium]|nr:hypothetical protein [Deltaproteobacteria bacterium]